MTPEPILKYVKNIDNVISEIFMNPKCKRVNDKEELLNLFTSSCFKFPFDACDEIKKASITYCRSVFQK